MKKIERIIKAIRESDHYIPAIYTQGGCYQFHLILKTIYPYAIPYYNSEIGHVATLHNGILYDINGKVAPDGYEYMDLTLQKIAKTWSFSRTKVLSINECPFCGEPIPF